MQVRYIYRTTDFGINSIHYFTEALFCPTPLWWRHHIMSGWCRNHRNHGNLLSTDHTENTDFLMSHRNHENLKSLTKIFSVSSVCSVDYFLTMMRKVVPWWGSVALTKMRSLSLRSWNLWFELKEHQIAS